MSSLVTENEIALTEHIAKLFAGDDPVARVAQFVRTEIDAAYQDNITVSTRESRAPVFLGQRRGLLFAVLY